MSRVSAKITIVAFAVAASTVHAQSDPRQILRGMIAQVQTGHPNPNWYGAELWQLIAYQTGNTGVYPQLTQLGAVRDVTINQTLPLPIGVMYAMTARHARGTSYWEFGISNLTNRIEYASFRADAGTASAPPPLTTDDASDREPGSRPEPDSSGKRTSTTDACRKFPNLCE